ncbi:MAG: alpha/beta fold hydrolase [Acidimicrobiia bacterium]|nr:alpha/beta fold hydrolase [Acidimicrobiia bacterium]
MPTPFSIDLGGRRLAGLDWGGRGPDLLFLHPNGFCAGLFDPIASRLGGAFRCLGVDLAGHGASDPPADLSTFTLADLATDVLAALDHLGVEQVRLVGHSLGGIVSVLVDEQRPGLVTAVLLCEAVILPPPEYFTMPPDRPPMADIARKRRAVWPDRAAMRARFAAQPPMAGLAPEALDAYLRWGVHDRPDGQVELACPPEVEAAVFEVTPTERGSLPAWEHLPALRGRAVVLSGDQTEVQGIFTPQAERVGCMHVVVPGGHLQLEEDTGRGADLVTRHLGGAIVG